MGRGISASRFFNATIEESGGRQSFVASWSKWRSAYSRRVTKVINYLLYLLGWLRALCKRCDRSVSVLCRGSGMEKITCESLAYREFLGRGRHGRATSWQPKIPQADERYLIFSASESRLEVDNRDKKVHLPPGGKCPLSVPKPTFHPAGVSSYACIHDCLELRATAFPLPTQQTNARSNCFRAPQPAVSLCPKLLSSRYWGKSVRCLNSSLSFIALPIMSRRYDSRVSSRTPTRDDEPCCELQLTHIVLLRRRSSRPKGAFIKSSMP